MIEENAEHREQHGSRKKPKKEYETRAKKLLGDEWNSIWTKYSKKPSRNPTAAQMTPLNHKRPWIHTPLAKAESSLATQIRTEKVGFADFLYRQPGPWDHFTGMSLWMAQTDNQTSHIVLPTTRESENSIDSLLNSGIIIGKL